VNIVNGTKNQAADNALTSYQALFAKLGSTSNSSKALPLSDLCYSAIKQMDSGKHSVRFVLKQLLLETTNANHRHAALQRSYENLKNNVTKLQQQYSAERLQLQQVNADLKQRLQARDQANKDLSDKVKEQQRIIDQFQQYHNRRTALSEDYAGSIQPSSASSPSNRSQAVVQPPLQRFIIQKEAQKQLQQQSYAASRHPNVLGSSRMNSSATSLQQPTQHPISRQIIPEGESQTTRPFTNPIRDFTVSSGYSFSERRVNSQTLAKQNYSTNTVSGSGAKHLVLNKRRRVEAAQFFTGASPIVNMSPTTAFTLNQGPYNAPTGLTDSAQWCNGQK
jgi:myosin heavy subunit